MIINIIGIYKITSPSNRIYIGQSVNIKKRFQKYKSLFCKEQPRLYNSFIKYNIKHHQFEIIEECLIEELNIRERYWQDYYNVLSNDKGLNCRLTETSEKKNKYSEETLRKMSQAKIGKVLSIETRLKIAKGNYKQVKCMNTLKTWESVIACAKENNINKKSLAVKLSGNFKNNTPYIYLDKIPQKGINYSCADIIIKKKVICTVTNKIWNTTRECAEENNINRSTLINKLSGHKNNNTTYEYIYNF